MARSISLIQSQINSSLQANLATVGITLDTTQWSKRNILRLLCFCVATAIAVLEQLIDVFTANVEAVAASAAPATDAWIQAQVFKFQYSATTPQIIQFTAGLAPYYPVVNSTLQIITRCSVTTTSANNVLIKVATGTTPAALSPTQLSALQAYISPPNGIGIAGVNYICSSGSADILFVQANVYYQGQYSGIIQANVINAINNYLAVLPFNGQVKISDLENTIRNVAGVNDVVLVNVSARANGGTATYLVQSEAVISRLWNTVAGYIVPEDPGSNDLIHQLTLIAE